MLFVEEKLIKYIYLKTRFKSYKVYEKIIKNPRYKGTLFMLFKKFGNECLDIINKYLFYFEYLKKLPEDNELEDYILEEFFSKLEKEIA